MTWNQIAERIASMTAEQREKTALHWSSETGEFTEIKDLLPAEEMFTDTPLFGKDHAGKIALLDFNVDDLYNQINMAKSQHGL